jgi:hypothetical protein
MAYRCFLVFTYFVTEASSRPHCHCRCRCSPLATTTTTSLCGFIVVVVLVVLVVIFIVIVTAVTTVFPPLFCDLFDCCVVVSSPLPHPVVAIPQVKI